MRYGTGKEIRCVLSSLFFFTAKISGRTRKCDLFDRFPLKFLPPFFPLSCHRHRFSPTIVFLIRSPLLFYDISCLKTENWSKLARARAREINSPFVSWKNSSFIIAVFFSVFSVRFFFAFCSFLSTAERSRVEIRDGR